MRKRIDVLLVILAIAIVLGGVGYWWFGGRTAANNKPAPQQTAKAERGDIRLTVASTGKIVSNLDVEIKCKASGEVTKLPFDVSDAVKKGELLVELDPVDEMRVGKQAEVSLSSSEARLVIAKQNLVVAERTLATDRKRADAALKASEARERDLRAKANRVRELLSPSSSV